MEDRAINDGSDDAPFFGEEILFKKFDKLLLEEDPNDKGFCLSFL